MLAARVRRQLCVLLCVLPCAAASLAACTGTTSSAPTRVEASTGAFGSGEPAADPDAGYVVTGIGNHREDVNPSFAAPLGRFIVTGTFPTTDNQVESTTDHMRVSVVDLESGELRWLQIPTSTGETSVEAPGGEPGGADVSDLCVAEVDDEPVLYGISAVPYKGWDVEQYGEFPMLFRLQAGSDDVHYESQDLSTYAGLRAAAATPELADEFLPEDDGEPVASAGLVECASLPNGSIAVTQYYPAEGAHSGRVVVFDPDGTLVAGLQLPDYTSTTGSPVTEMLPRDLTASTTLIDGTVNLAVVSDSFDAAGTALPFPVTEIGYDPSASTLSVLGGPFVASAGHRSNRTAYSEYGDLYVPVTVPDPQDEGSVWSGAGIAMFPRALLDTHGPSQVVRELAPQSFLGTAGKLSVDVHVLEDQNLIVDVDFRGGVTAYRLDDGSACASLSPDLPADLAAYDAQLQAVMKGSYDATREYLWLPMNVTADEGSDVPQLYGVNVADLADQCGG